MKDSFSVLKKLFSKHVLVKKLTKKNVIDNDFHVFSKCVKELTSQKTGKQQIKNIEFLMTRYTETKEKYRYFLEVFPVIKIMIKSTVLKTQRFIARTEKQEKRNSTTLINSLDDKAQLPKKRGTAFSRKAFGKLLPFFNQFLFSYDYLPDECRLEIIESLSELMWLIDYHFKIPEKMELLVKIYFGIQYFTKMDHDYENYKKGKDCLENLLQMIDEEIRFLQTTFYFDDQETFLRMSLRYNNEIIYDTKNSNVSDFYFELINRIIVENDSKNSFTMKWAEGNLISVMGSIKKDKLAIVTKPEFINALCQIVLNQTKDNNIVFALQNLQRISKMSEECEFLINKFFESKGIKVSKMYGYLGKKFFNLNEKEREKMILRLKMFFTTNLPFKRKLKSTNFSNISVVTHK